MKAPWTLIFLIALLLSNRLSAQKIIQFEEERTDESIQLAPGISIPTVVPGYTLVMPEHGETQGMIVFFDADRAASNDIHQYANSHQLAVLFTSTQNYLDFFFNKADLLQVEGYIQKVVEEYNIPKNNLLFTGMSLAGTRALKLALFSKSADSKSELTPKAIAICDSPLDFVRFWNENNRAKKIQFNATTTNAGQWITGWLEKNLGGQPNDKMKAYLDYSPYSYQNPDNKQLALLKGMAIRTYTEPDVDWWIQNRGKDYYGMNALDMAGLINELKLQGHPDVELITTENKGYFPDGTRHPHSWSIVDQKELVDWFLTKIKR